MLTAVFADVLARIREKLGVQGLRGDRMLLELRDRIRAQGKLPELGEGWGSSLVLKPAGGSSFGGDFVVSFWGTTLGALLDVSGTGIDAGSGRHAVGAFGGSWARCRWGEFLPACNADMRRGRPARASSPPCTSRWTWRRGSTWSPRPAIRPPCTTTGRAGRWRLTQAHGIVLGVLPDLHGAATQPERGVLQRGDALMLYTDGLVEAPGRDIDAGTDRCSERPNACWPDLEDHGAPGGGVPGQGGRELPGGVGPQLGD